MNAVAVKWVSIPWENTCLPKKVNRWRHSLLLKLHCCSTVNGQPTKVAFACINRCRQNRIYLVQVNGVGWQMMTTVSGNLCGQIFLMLQNALQSCWNVAVKKAAARGASVWKQISDALHSVPVTVRAVMMNKWVSCIAGIRVWWVRDFILYFVILICVFLVSLVHCSEACFICNCTLSSFNDILLHVRITKFSQFEILFCATWCECSALLTHVLSCQLWLSHALHFADFVCSLLFLWPVF